MDRRRLELAIASAAVALFATAAAVGLLWRFVFDFEPWDAGLPPWPGMEGWSAFALYEWIPIAAAVGLSLIVGARWRGFRVAPLLAGLICALTVMLYLPFAASLAYRVDRLRGPVRDPVPEVRLLVSVIVVTVALALVYVMTRARFAVTVAVILNGLLLHICWLFFIMPFGGWYPADSSREELLGPFRPCRGALVWRVEYGHARPYGRIDELWLRFADPAAEGRVVPATSLVSERRAEYLWLRDHDLSTLQVRTDDPAVLRCDSTRRPERVAAEKWHRIGLR